MSPVFRRVTQDQIGPSASADLAGWLFFQIAAGHIALPILAATFLFSSSAHRPPLVINVLATWIIQAIFSSLLFYVSKQDGPEPGSGLCVAQSSLLEGSRLMTCTAVLVLALYLQRKSDPNAAPLLLPKRGTFVLMGVPYMVLSIFSAIGVALAVQHIDRVSRERQYFYCSLDWEPYTIAVAVLATLLCATAIIIQLRTAHMLSQQWSSISRRSQLDRPDLNLMIRLGIFTAYLTTSTAINLASIWAVKNVLPDMFSASVGMALFLIFVSDRDVIHAWKFWKKQPRIRTSATSSYPIDIPARSGHAAQTSHTSMDTFSTASYASEKARQDNLKNYYQTRLADTGKGPQIIGRPSEAFPRDDEPRQTAITSLHYDRGVSHMSDVV